MLYCGQTPDLVIKLCHFLVDDNKIVLNCQSLFKLIIPPPNTSSP